MSQATTDGGSSLVQLHSKQGSIRITSNATTIAVGMLQQGLEGKTSQLEMKAQKDIYVGTTNKDVDAVNLFNKNKSPGSWVGDSGKGIVTIEAGENLIIEGGRFGIYQPLTKKNISASSTFTAGKSVQVSGRVGAVRTVGTEDGENTLQINAPVIDLHSAGETIKVNQNGQQVERAFATLQADGTSKIQLGSTTGSSSVTITADKGNSIQTAK